MVMRMMMMSLLTAVRPEMNDRNARSVSESVSSVTHLSLIQRKFGSVSQPRYCAVWGLSVVAIYYIISPTPLCYVRSLLNNADILFMMLLPLNLSLTISETKKSEIYKSPSSLSKAKFMEIQICILLYAKHSLKASAVLRNVRDQNGNLWLWEWSWWPGDWSESQWWWCGWLRQCSGQTGDIESRTDKERCDVSWESWAEVSFSSGCWRQDSYWMLRGPSEHSQPTRRGVERQRVVSGCSSLAFAL